jgi:hypothetical protein
MHKKIIRFLLLFIIFLFCTGNSYALSSSEILNTDHFIIQFDSKSSSCAAALATRLESYHEIITSFLDIEITNRVEIFLAAHDNEKLQIIKNSSALYISTDGNLIDPDKNIYSDIFNLYLQNITINAGGNSSIDKNFINALMCYPVTDQKFTELIINDLAANSGITDVQFKNIETYDNEIQFAVFTALITFIISDYNKKILMQSIRDTHYYDGFYKALSSITGDSESVIAEKFNVYLLKQKSVSDAESDNKTLVLKNDDGFTDISFDISGNGQIAVIQKKTGSYRLLLKRGENETVISLNSSQKGSIFNDIDFAGDDKLALSETGKTGSTVHVFDTESNKMTVSIFIPYLFISDINHFKNNEYIFTAGCGLTSGIYTLNTSDGKFSIITESGNYYSPIMIKDKIYFISAAAESNIMEFDKKSNELKTLFSTDQKISHLDSAAEGKLIFSLKLNGLENIYTLDIKSGNLQRITNGASSNILPRVSETGIFYFSFYKSKYRIFSADHKPADI